MFRPVRAAVLFLACLSACWGGVTGESPPLDAGEPDAGQADAGVHEVDGGGGRSDAGGLDAGSPGIDAGTGSGAHDAGSADSGAGADAGSGTDAGVGADAGVDGGCFVSSVGVYGECMLTSACAALGNNASWPGYCPGPADIECCTLAPSTANNPPVPAGWKLMSQSAVTPDMTNWAVQILYDPVDYPMFSMSFRSFDAQSVMARVEWHPPDFQNNTVHRGVTLYVPE